MASNKKTTYLAELEGFWQEDEIIPYSVRWQNFRSFDDTGEVNIKPLTVIIGPNNCGKSSVIAPLLILKQTLESSDPAQALKTKGELIDAGIYRDFVIGHDTDAEVSFCLDFLTLIKSKSEPIPEMPAVPPGSCELVFGSSDSGQSLELRKFVVRDAYGRLLIRHNRLENGRYSLSGEWYRKQTKQRETKSRAAIRKNLPRHFLFMAEPVMRRFISDRFSIESNRRGKKTSELEIPGALVYYSATLDVVRSFFLKRIGSASYIGPLRERPARAYELSGEVPMTVGRRGENAPEILFRKRASNLVRNVEKWLREFDFANKLKLHELAVGAFCLELQSEQQKYSVNLADTGFGVSQVLPLIVEGFNTSAGGTIIAEQPEIHLNPRQQAKLADLFVDFALNNRNVITETHSEHLLLRLRRLVAEGRIASDQIALHYVEKVGDRSTIREVPIQTNGHIEIENWPKGFFEGALRESLGLAGAQARKRKEVASA